MKRLLLILAFLILCSPAEAAITHIFSVANFAGSGATVTTATHAAGTTNNFYIVMCSASGTANTLTVSNSGSNFTWTQIGTTQLGQGENWGLFKAFASDTTTRTFTCAGSGGSGFAGIKLTEFNGVDTTTPVGPTNGNDFAFANAASGALTVNIAPVASGLTIWAGADDSVTAVGAGYSAAGNDANGDRSEYKIGASSGSQAANFTGSGAWVLAAVAINPQGAAAACSSSISLLGVGCK